MITITEKAINKLKEISDSENIGHYSARIKIIGGGCSGYSYDMFFDNSISETDEVVSKDGVSVIIDELSIQYMENVEIDFVSDKFESGFKFNNPSVKSTCGCGSSVSF